VAVTVLQSLSSNAKSVIEHEQQRWRKRWVAIPFHNVWPQLNHVADKMEKPLEGTVLCCTSIAPEQRVGCHAMSMPEA
jgi:macrodomain Ter protein organizer (MatP/YcbG family)